jgi:hypothetical protein
VRYATYKCHYADSNSRSQCTSMLELQETSDCMFTSFSLPSLKKKGLWDRHVVSLCVRPFVSLCVSHQHLLNQLVDLMRFRMEVIPLKLTSTPYIYSRSFNLSKMAEFKLLRWMRNFNHATWYHEIFYANRYSKDESFLRHFRRNKKIYKREGRLKV